MCICGLTDGIHWYVDRRYAPNLYQVATTPEEAEYNLLHWAGKILRSGHMHLDMRPMAAKILACRSLNMIAICSNNSILHPNNRWFE